MDRNDFQPDTRYEVTMRRADGGRVAAAFYVHRTGETWMIVRVTGQSAVLRKIAYADVDRIVAAAPVPPERRLGIPQALLDDRLWRDRDELTHYASSASRGT